MERLRSRMGLRVFREISGWVNWRNKNLELHAISTGEMRILQYLIILFHRWGKEVKWFHKLSSFCMYVLQYLYNYIYLTLFPETHKHKYSTSGLLWWFSYEVMSDSCDSTGCSPRGSSVHGILQARILGWLLFPSPGDLPDLGIEPGLLRCRQILYWLSYKRSPRASNSEGIMVKRK